MHAAKIRVFVSIIKDQIGCVCRHYNKFHERTEITMINKTYSATKIIGTQYSAAVRCLYSSAFFPWHRYFHSVLNAETGSFLSIAFITLNFAAFKSL